MIDRLHRFHGRGSLRATYQSGGTVRDPLLNLKYLKGTHRSSYRAAVVVSKKVHKSAVVRNRIRRRVYNILRVQLAEHNEAVDLVFTVFSDQLATIEAGELESRVVKLLQAAGVIGVPKEETHGIVGGKEK